MANRTPPSMHPGIQKGAANDGSSISSRYGNHTSHLLANSLGESTLKPLVSREVSYSSSVVASAFGSLSPCASYRAFKEVMTGWSGFTSRVRRPRMYSMARLSPMACIIALLTRYIDTKWCGSIDGCLIHSHEESVLLVSQHIPKLQVLELTAGLVQRSESHTQQRNGVL